MIIAPRVRGVKVIRWAAKHCQTSHSSQPKGCCWCRVTRYRETCSQQPQGLRWWRNCCCCRCCRRCRYCAPMRGRTPPKRSSSRSARADVLTRAAAAAPAAGPLLRLRRVAAAGSGAAASGCRGRAGAAAGPAAGGREQAAGAGAAAGAAGAGARGSTLTCPNVNRCTDVTLLRRTRQGGPRGDSRTPQPKLRCKATRAARARLGTFPYVSLEAAGVRGGWAVYLCHFVKGNEGLDNGGQELCVFGRAGD